MLDRRDSYKVVPPIGKSNIKQQRLAGPIADLAGKTICAMRHTFRADETFPMIEALFREKYAGIKFVSNHEMPDPKISLPKEEAELAKVLREKGCNILLTGNGA